MAKKVEKKKQKRKGPKCSGVHVKLGVEMKLPRGTSIISAVCATCSEYQSSPFRFRASLSTNDIALNRELAIDLLWLINKPVLNIIDTHTAYQNAEFIESKHTGSLLESLLSIWTTVFISYPSTIRFDQESA